MFKYVVLGLLYAGGRRHGYALMKDYHDRFGFKLSTGNFYRELQKLVNAGAVRTVERAADDDVRRAPYEITDSGKTRFRDWFIRVHPSSLSGGHEDTLGMRMAFLADVSDEDAKRVLGFFQDELWIQAKSLERMRERVSADATTSGSKSFPVLALMLSRRIRKVAAELAFLDDLKTTHEEWKSAQRPVRAPIERAAPMAKGRGGTAGPSRARSS